MNKYAASACYVSLLLLTASIHVRAQDSPQLNPSALPPQGVKAEDFAPRGWKVAARATGDLNGDGRVDQVIQLVPHDYDYSGITAAPESQALLILFSSDDGRLQRAASTTKLLVSLVPQYIFQLSIKNGVLIVNQNYGMTDVTDITHRFRYDAKTGRFLLIGKDTFNYHRPQGPRWPGIRISENYLTGVRITTKDRWLRTGTNNPSTQHEEIARSRIFIEDVDEGFDK